MHGMMERWTLNKNCTHWTFKNKRCSIKRITDSGRLKEIRGDGSISCGFIPARLSSYSISDISLGFVIESCLIPAYSFWIGLLFLWYYCSDVPVVPWIWKSGPNGLKWDVNCDFRGHDIISSPIMVPSVNECMERCFQNKDYWKAILSLGEWWRMDTVAALYQLAQHLILLFMKLLLG